MNKTIYKGMVGAVVLILAACSGNEEAPLDCTSQPILLSVGMETPEVEAVTRAGTSVPFPNGGKMALIAAEVVEGKVLNWTSYADIQNAVAYTANTGSDARSVYTFGWGDAGKDRKYYPFDGTKLTFLAYSPVAAAGSAVERGTTSGTSLNLTLKADGKGCVTPDILYAGANSTSPRANYDKTQKTPIDLGTFQHALSQVKIVVTTTETSFRNVKVTALSFTTVYPTATLDLLTNILTLGATGTITYPFIQNPAGVSFTKEKPIVNYVMVYPGTHLRGNAKVDITLNDNGLTVTRSFDISTFRQTGIEEGVTFERGKTTTLTLTIHGKDVSAPDTNIHLTSSLSEWEDKGKYEVAIQ